ncbi:MAG: hypothetical protein ACFCGT_12030 [Sandaracinaceae bacterium]
MRTASLPWVLAVVLGGSACGGSSWLDTPTDPLPCTLSEGGLYPELPRSLTPDPRVVAFRPTWELWTNGSTKERFLLLPPGVTVDTADGEAWAYPVGTVLFKTFAYDTVEGRRPIETRVIRRTAEGWAYDAYRWADDGSDATLLDLDRSTPVEVEDELGAVTHEIPSRRQCRICHEANATIPIGFDELRLGPVLDDLEAAGVLSEAVDEPERVEADDLETVAVLGYLHGNCAHCHNGRPGPSNAFDLSHDVALDNTVGRETMSSGAEPGLRIAPGAPDESVVYRALAGVSPMAMPPVGVQRRDTVAAERLRLWIEGLEPLE